MKMGFISFLIVYLVLFKDSGTLFFKDSENILDEYFGKYFDPAHDKFYKMACAPSEDSDQPEISIRPV